MQLRGATRQLLLGAFTVYLGLCSSSADAGWNWLTDFARWTGYGYGDGYHRCPAPKPPRDTPFLPCENLGLTPAKSMSAAPYFPSSHYPSPHSQVAPFQDFAPGCTPSHAPAFAPNPTPTFAPMMDAALTPQAPATHAEVPGAVHRPASSPWFGTEAAASDRGHTSEPTARRQGYPLPAAAR